MTDTAARVILKAGETTAKFLNILVGKDGSIYVHMYRPSGTPWMAPPPALVNIPAGVRQRLDFDHFTPSPFQYNKVSFHPSGYIHLTDTAGKRLRDGVRGPSFRDLKLPHDFGTFVPCEPTRLPQHTPGRYLDLVFDLPAPVQPLYVTLSLVDPDAPPPSALASIFEKPVLVRFKQHRLLVAVSLWLVRAMDPTPVPWPPFL